jgi:hypothetical protein
MSKVEVTVEVELDEVIRSANTDKVVAALLVTHDLTDLVSELKEQSAEFVNDLIGDMDAEELVAAVLYGIGPDHRTMHGWLREFREKLDKECGGPLAAKGEKAESPKVDFGPRHCLSKPVYIDGREWRFAGEMTFAEITPEVMNGWRLPRTQEWLSASRRIHDAAKSAISLDRFAWVGGQPVQRNSIVMWAFTSHNVTVGNPEASGAVWLVKGEEAPVVYADGALRVNGLRWRFAGNHIYATALRGETDGWRLPTREEWRRDNDIVADLDPGHDQFGTLLAWIGGEKQNDDGSILMWEPGDALIETGDATDAGATFFVKEEK